MEYKNKFGKEVPTSYLDFLNKNPNGCYINFRVDPDYKSNTKIYSETELTENIEMDHIGNALTFECLKLYIKFQRDFGFADVDEPNLNEEEMKRVENGFVVGYGENFAGYGYVYFDTSDNYSVWMYDTNNGHIMKVANSFDDFINNAKIID